MSRKLKLHGKLAEFIGIDEFDVKVNTVGQAVSFLINNFPQLEKYMSSQYYQVKIGSYLISEEEINYPSGKEDIHIVPVISGAGDALRNIILGAALITGAVLLSPIAFSLKTGFAMNSANVLAQGALAVGGMLLLNGVSSLLFPIEEPDVPEDDPRLSFSFNGLQNTSRAGTSVPIVYGEMFTGSIVISAAIDTNQVQVESD